MIPVYQLLTSRNVSLPSTAGLTTGMTGHPAGFDHYNGGSILWFSFRNAHAEQVCWATRQCDGEPATARCVSRSDARVWMRCPGDRENHPARSQISLTRCCLRIMRTRDARA